MTGRFFVGGYVKDAELVAISSAMSGHNALFLGEPGTGKTDMVKEALRRMFPPQLRGWFEFDASTPPEPIKGSPDPALLLASPPVYKVVIEGTAFDPSIKAYGLDEAGRLPDVGFDILLHALNRNTDEAPDGPVFMGTANEPPKSVRTAAFRDRFAYWYWADPGTLNVRQIVEASMSMLGTNEKLTFAGDLPDYDRILKIRHMIPGPHAIEAVIAMIESLVAEIQAQQIPAFKPNQRRIRQWNDILFRTAAHFTDSDDFGIIPKEAANVLKYAQITLTQGEWAKWAEIASAVADTVGVAIERAGKAAFQSMKSLRTDYSNDKTTMAIKMVEQLANVEKDLNAISTSDARAVEYLSKLRVAMSKFISGQDPDSLD